MKDLRKEIEKERDKLTCLVNHSIKAHQPIGVNDVIIAQSRKLDSLFGKLARQKEVEKLMKNNPSPKS